MGFMLGNLTAEQMQARAGVSFPEELLHFLRRTHDPIAAGVRPGQWHCFDVPFAMVCGDMETATTVHQYLAPLSSQFAEIMQIMVEDRKVNGGW